MTCLEVRPRAGKTVELDVAADEGEDGNVPVLRRRRVTPEVDEAYLRVVLFQPLDKRVNHGQDCPGIVASVIGYHTHADGVLNTANTYVHDNRVDGDRVLRVERRLHLLTEAHQPILREIHLHGHLDLILKVLALVSHSLVLMGCQFNVNFDAGESRDQGFDELVLGDFDGHRPQLLDDAFDHFLRLLENKRQNNKL